MFCRVLGLALSCALACVALPAAGAAADGGPIMPLSEVQAGMNCTGKTVVQGTTISSFDVHVISVVQSPGEGLRILIRASGPAVDSTGIAEGFSGSPVYCRDSRGTIGNAGAISEGVGDYGNHLALVTPIEQMLGEPVTPPPDIQMLRMRSRELGGPLMVGGVSPAILRVLQQAGHSAGREVLSAPSPDPAANFPVQPLVPGASVAASYSTGAIPFAGIGTVTYRDGANVYAFGHPFDDVGRRSLLLQDAYVYDVVGDPDPAVGSYKLAAPGHTEGMLTSDTPNALIGQIGPAPTLIPVHISARDDDTGRTIEEDTAVADETDIGNPLGSSLLGLILPVAVGEASIDVYDGPPAAESGRMCLTIEIRELQGPLHFCNRYVGSVPAGPVSLPELASAAGNDAGTAVSLLDSEQFAQLHVLGAQVSIDAARGLAQATIVAAHAPRRVKAGKRVMVQLIVRRYRGPLQTVSFMLQIPRRVHGELSASILGHDSQSQGGPGELESVLSAALGGGPPPGTPSPPPTSLASLRKDFAGIATYDGLVVRFSHHGSERAYRDPALLINGRARLRFRVR